MATRIDTLKTYETIAAAGVDDKAARAISNAIANASNDWRADLATKTDLENLRLQLVGDFNTRFAQVDTSFAKIGKEIADGQKATVTWFIGTVLAATTVIIAVSRLAWPVIAAH